MLQGSVCGFGGWLSHGGCLPAYTVLGQHEQAMEPDLWSQTCGARPVEAELSASCAAGGSLGEELTDS